MSFTPIKTPWIAKKLFPNYIWDISTTEKVIYLTFDDGPTTEITEWTLKQLKKYTNSPVTYCENYIYWTNKLKDVAKAVDIISVHSYPVWVGTPIKEAVQTCIDEYQMITKMYPKKPVIITETGWPTRSNGQGIPKDFANQANQLYYYDQIQKWSEDKQVTCFFFEAFDEFWKGSERIDEPEKHWGYYYDNRTPKRIKTK